MSECPPRFLAGATKDLAERIATLHNDLVRFALEALSVEQHSASINLTLAAREVGVALTKVRRISDFPVEHTRS